MLAPDMPSREAFLAPAPPPQSFALETDRIRLSEIALKAFKGIASRWNLTNAESASLLGVSASTWDRMKRGAWRDALSQDQLTRASALIGIFKGLSLLFADDMKDRWPRLANRGPVFDGLSPVAVMIEGGIPRMLEVRRLVDAVRGGI